MHIFFRTYQFTQSHFDPLFKKFRTPFALYIPIHYLYCNLNPSPTKFSSYLLKPISNGIFNLEFQKYPRIELLINNLLCCSFNNYLVLIDDLFNSFHGFKLSVTCVTNTPTIKGNWPSISGGGQSAVPSLAVINQMYNIVYSGEYLMHCGPCFLILLTYYITDGGIPIQHCHRVLYYILYRKG